MMHWLIVMCAGCIVVPTMKTTTNVVHSTSTSTVDPDESFELEAKLHAARLAGVTWWNRDCRREVVDVVDVTRKRGPKLVNVDETGDPRNSLADLLLAPATLVTSGIVTAIVIAVSHKTTSRQTQISEHRAACPYAAANVAVAVTMPSGTTLDAVTNAGGQFVVNIPRTEASKARWAQCTHSTRTSA